MESPISLREYVERRFEDQDKAVQAALAAAEKAVLKKEEEVERWRAAANEWRGALSDRERDYLSRREFYSIIGTVVGLIGLALTLYIGFKK
jgi:hypothetical protein